MSITTDTYWDINGVPLQTMAYNIDTWGGSLQAPPPLRGADVTIPYVPGQVLQKRMPNSRTLSFSMWVVGADEDGNVPEDVSMRTQFEANLKKLRNLFWNYGEPVTLTKRWRDFGSSVIRTATATAIFSNGFVPAMTGRQRAVFNVDMFLPDPFFYGSEETVTFTAGTTSVTRDITVLGDYPTDRIVISFSGPRNNMRMTNQTLSNSYVNVSRDLSQGSTITLDVANWTAKMGDTNVIRYLTFQGNTSWLLLRPGAQRLILSSVSGTGGATLRYRPRWI